MNIRLIYTVCDIFYTSTSCYILYITGLGNIYLKGIKSKYLGLARWKPMLSLLSSAIAAKAAISNM